MGSLSEELRNAAAHAAALGASVEIVGAWVWATFAQKPPKESREAMSAAGYHWNRKRKCWQYAGVPSRHSDASEDELKQKYGAVRLQAAA